MTSKLKKTDTSKKSKLTKDNKAETPVEPPPAADKPQLGNVEGMVGELSTHEVNPAAVKAFEDAEAKKAATMPPAAQSAAQPSVVMVKKGRPAGAKTGTGPRSKFKGATQPAAPKPTSYIGGQNQTPGAIPGMPPMVDSRPAAQSLVALEEMLCTGLLNDEWAMSKEEREANIQAITQYFNSKGGVEMSPLATVVMLQVGYAAQRFVKPKTQTKIGLAKAWIIDKWSTFKNRKKVKQYEGDKPGVVKNGALPDSGNNNVGENLVSDPFKPSVPGAGS